MRPMSLETANQGPNSLYADLRHLTCRVTGAIQVWSAHEAMIPVSFGDLSEHEREESLNLGGNQELPLRGIETLGLR